MHINVLSYRLTRIGGKLVSAATCALTGHQQFSRSAALGAALAFGAMPAAQAFDVLIVDYGIVATIDTNVQARQATLGNTATITTLANIPANFSQYGQVWDLGANRGIDGAYSAALTTYLQGGGTVFMMGENAGYGATRNAAMSTFMASLGAGTVTVTGNSAAVQTVLPQFQTANASSSVSFAAVGKYSSVGNGICITSDCGAAAWGIGSLANAPLGAVISVLDVNFLGDGYLQGDFTDNLISYLTQQQQIGAGGGTPPVNDIDTANGTPYAASNLGPQLNPAFKGGTLDIDAPSMTLAQNFTLGTGGGHIQAIGTEATLTGVLSDEVSGTPGDFGVTGAGGTVTLTGVNTYTGATSVDSGSTLRLGAGGSIAASSGVATNGTFDVSATAGAAITSLSGTGTVALGAQTLTLTGANGTFAGAIGGTGNVAVTGGTETLTGVNTYTGTTQVGSGATLRVAGTGSIAASSGVANAGTFDISGASANVSVSTLTGTGNVLLGSRTLVLGQGSGAYGGTISGAGNVELGGGNLTFTSNQAFTGVVTLSGGSSLNVNSQIAGGVNVQTGSVLRGSGVIAGNIIVASGGRLAPGNSPGVLTTGASVNLAPGATFEVEINGATAGNGAGFHDQLNVVGAGNTFNANGATLDVNLTTIAGLGAYTPYVPTLGQTFRIVNAEGGLGATRFDVFAQPVGLASGTRFRVLYGAAAGTAVDLKVVPVSFAEDSASHGVNRNGLSAASALDRMLAADDAGTATVAQRQLANTAISLTSAQLDRAVVGLAGEIHGATVAAQPIAGRAAQSSVTKHLTMSGAPVPGTFAGWADYTTGSARWSADSVSSSARASHNQLIVGVDVWQNETARVGVAAAQSTVHVGSASGGSGRLEENSAIAYGQHRTSGWIADAQVGVGTGSSRTNRLDPFAAQDTTVYSQTALTTDLSTRQQFVSAGVRRAVEVAKVTLEPFARVAVQHVQREAGTEGTTTPSALTLDKYSATGTRVVAGVSFASDAKNPMAAQMTYRGTVAIGGDQGRLGRPAATGTLSGQAVRIAAPEAGRAFVQADLFGTWLITPGAYVYAGITGEARSKQVDKSVVLGTAIAF